MRRLLIGLAAIGLAIPLTFLGTLLLLPFWRWLEPASGIESIGHSGPAEWCYIATVAVCAVSLGAAAIRWF